MCVVTYHKHYMLEILYYSIKLCIYFRCIYIIPVDVPIALLFDCALYASWHIYLIVVVCVALVEFFTYLFVPVRGVCGSSAQGVENVFAFISFLFCHVRFRYTDRSPVWCNITVLRLEIFLICFAKCG